MAIDNGVRCSERQLKRSLKYRNTCGGRAEFKRGEVETNLQHCVKRSSKIGYRTEWASFSYPFTEAQVPPYLQGEVRMGYSPGSNVLVVDESTKDIYDETVVDEEGVLHTTQDMRTKQVISSERGLTKNEKMLIGVLTGLKDIGQIVIPLPNQVAPKIDEDNIEYSYRDRNAFLGHLPFGFQITSRP